MIDQRNRKTAPVSASKKSHRFQLMVLIDKTAYFLQVMPCHASTWQSAYRFLKEDGVTYDVTQSDFGLECDCPDFIFRRESLDPDGCKHIRALVESGIVKEQCNRNAPGTSFKAPWAAS